MSSVRRVDEVQVEEFGGRDCVDYRLSLSIIGADIYLGERCIVRVRGLWLLFLCTRSGVALSLALGLSPLGAIGSSWRLYTARPKMEYARVFPVRTSYAQIGINGRNGHHCRVDFRSWECAAIRLRNTPSLRYMDLIVTAIPHIGILCISCKVQYFLMLSAPSALTSSSRCAQSTSPKVSIKAFISSNLSSFSPLLQACRYASN